MSYDVQVSADGGAWATWLTGTKATSDVWLGRDGVGYAFRVRARDSKGNVGACNVASRVRRHALPRAGRVRPRRRPTASPYRTGPDTDAARLGDARRRHDRRGDPRARSAPTATPGTRSPSRSAEWNPVTFVERGVWVAARSSTATHVAAYRAPNSTLVNAGLTGLDFGGERRPPSGRPRPRMPAGASRPTATAPRTSCDCAGRTPSPWTSLTLKVYRTGRHARRHAWRCRPRATGARAWDWNGRGRTAPRRRTAGTSSSSSARPARPDVRAPSARPVDRRPGRRPTRVTVDTVRPRGLDGVRHLRRSSRPTATAPATAPGLTLTATGATRWTARVDERGRHGRAERPRAPAARPPSPGPARTTPARASRTGGTPSRSPRSTTPATLPRRTLGGHRGHRRPRPCGPPPRPRIFSPNGDGAARHDRPRAGPRTRRRPARPGSGRGRRWSGPGPCPALTAWKATWNGRDADGTRGEGRHLHVQGQRHGRRREPRAPRRCPSSWTGPRARCAGRAASSRRTATPCGPPSALTWQPDPHRDDDAPPLRRGRARSCAPSGPAGRRPPGTRGWTWNGTHGRRDLRAPGPVHGAAHGDVDARAPRSSTRSVWAAAFAVTPSATTVDGRRRR